ncbi:MAG: galactonate dehydratase [Cocleimonas sp.]|jgi:galactonate dehydratase
MKIKRLRLYPVAPRWCFLAIDTDEGITGWGEPLIEGKVATVMAAVEELGHYLIGQDPCQINDLWQVLYRGGFYRGGPILMSAIAGIDQALWDIKGKFMQQPVHQLLGGLVRNKMPIYSWVGGDDPADEIAQIRTQTAIGRNVFKLNGCGKLKQIDGHQAVDDIISRIGAIRDEFGSSIDFGLDFHGRVSVPMAKVLLKELEPFRPLFVEEPVLAEHYEHYEKLNNSTSIVLAAGERMFSRYEFKRVLTQGGLGIIQPDVSHAGGISECVKIAAMAEAFDVSLAPHCPLGPIALAASLTVDFISYNAILQETSMGMHYNKQADVLDYVLNKEDFSISEGCMKPLTKPGLGVELDENAIIEASKIHSPWRNPLWRHNDGSVAEW